MNSLTYNTFLLIIAYEHVPLGATIFGGLCSGDSRFIHIKDPLRPVHQMILHHNFTEIPVIVADGLTCGVLSPTHANRGPSDLLLSVLASVAENGTPICHCMRRPKVSSAGKRMLLLLTQRYRAWYNHTPHLRQT